MKTNDRTFENVREDVMNLIGDIDRLMMKCPNSKDERRACRCDVCLSLMDVKEELRASERQAEIAAKNAAKELRRERHDQWLEYLASSNKEV